MSVTTKRGDEGKSELLFGRRVDKTDLRLEVYGTLDELNAFLGLAKAEIGEEDARRIIHSCQCDLFTISSELATEKHDLPSLERRLGPEQVQGIEEHIEGIEARLQPAACRFIIPGENRATALLDVCRAVTRRAERLAWKLDRQSTIVNRNLLVYLNRLSDLLWLLARTFEKEPHTFPHDA